MELKPSTTWCRVASISMRICCLRHSYMIFLIAI